MKTIKNLNVRSEKIIENWNSTSKLDKIEELRFLSSEYKKLWIIYRFTTTICRYIILGSPFLMLITVFGVNFLTALIVSSTVLTTSLICGIIIRKKSLFLAADYFIHNESLNIELNDYK